MTHPFDDRPLLVFWETTKACGLACQHCRAGAIIEPGPDELSLADGFALVESLATDNAPHPILILTGGDCLMRKDLVEIAAHASLHRVPVAIAPSVTPRLKASILKQLRTHQVKTASLSLDGASAATHDALRGIPGSFQATIEGIQLLREHGFTVQINTTILNTNLEDLAQIAAIIKRERVDIWELFFLINTGRGTELTAPSAAINEEVCEFLVDASCYGFRVRTVEAPFFRRIVAQRSTRQRSVPDHDLVAQPLYRRLRTELFDLLGPPSSPPRAPLVATRDGKGIIFVAANGDIFPSGFLPLPLGNVKTESVLSVYKSNPLLQSIRSAAFHGRCGACAYADMCGGSRARAWATTRDPLGEDAGCVWMTNLAGSVAPR